jgi:hypothetical protein
MTSKFQEDIENGVPLEKAVMSLAKRQDAEWRASHERDLSLFRKLLVLLAIIGVFTVGGVALSTLLTLGEDNDDARVEQLAQENARLLSAFKAETMLRRQAAADTDRSQCVEIENLKTAIRVTLSGVRDPVARAVLMERFKPREATVKGLATTRTLRGVEACGSLPNRVR